MSEAQLYLIAILASVIVFILNRLYQRTGKKVPEAVLTISVYVVSFCLAVVWEGISIPTLPACSPSDPGRCVNDWLNIITIILQSVGGYVAFATLIYQALLKKIMDGYIPGIWHRITKRKAG